jgi:NAD(P)-dependent dehydrogenase (short-subunit alcohol dehydrogenase family)
MSASPSPKVAVVTGASAGIGRATALALAREGADLGLLSRNRERLESLAAEIAALGRRALVIPLDVADAEAVEAAATRVEAELGPIDVWVNNAMVSVFSPIAEMRADEFRRVMEVNYLGAVYGTLAALRRMSARQDGRSGGSIVLVGSALAYRGIPLQSAYCASKHALEGFNDSLQSELLHERSAVRVTMVQLSAFNTPQFDWVRSRLPGKAQPLAPVFQPELAAQAIVWASRHGGRELKVGFPAWMAIWGDKLFPRLGDWYLARKAFEGQQASEPRDPQARDNLFETVPGAFGAHGRFDRIAKTHSLQLWLATHRAAAWLSAGAVCVLLGIALLHG